MNRTREKVISKNPSLPLIFEFSKIKYKKIFIFDLQNELQVEK